MAGIMPEGGVSASGAFNSISDPLLVDGCTALWHAPRCVPRFDPAAANAVIAEMLNVMKCAGIPYDCNAKDNLCKAIEHHVIAGRYTGDLDGGPTPIVIPGGNNRRLGGGTFVIPNSYHEAIVVMAEFNTPIQFAQQSPAGNGERVEFNVDVSTEATFATRVVGLDQIIAGSNFAGGDFQIVLNDNATKIFRVPSGGLTLHWRARSTTQGNDQWRLQFSVHALQVKWYGVNGTQGDIDTTLDLE